jgi:NitT/TauT family transport system substrate-binding protein
MLSLRQLCGAFADARALFGDAIAHAQDTLKVAAGQRGNWDTTIAEMGQRAGIFKKHGLTLEILWTQGGGETQQAVISGSVDIGVAPGIMGVLSAFSKGAPVRIIGAETTGARISTGTCRAPRRSRRSRTPTARRSPTRPTARRRTASSPRS